ncbi:hypothetical protein KUCAC02_008792 [Xyrichtys novacula]|uniref:Reverse transcriptase n=1 Tax=Xyrichtys novacula TaxID=13765 RepID=A0AAV1FXI2_XYRNO|nr:hypothetical protein KUCAC02_008792 [Xyrichtys novacula]
MDHCLAQVGHHSLSLESLCKGEQVIQEDLYVINDLHIALLSRPPSVKLNLVSRVDSVDKAEMEESYPELCQGLGKLQQPYTIKAKTRCYSFFRSLNIWSQSESPTKLKSQLNGILVWFCFCQKNGSVHICVDLTQLDKAVCREKYTLPSVEQTLGSLAGAQVFSKLDANRGFWQILLSPESA